LATIENRYWGGVDEGGYRGWIAQLNRRALMFDRKSLKPADYAGGCHQPPKASQFMAGKSGNPKESPKDSLPAGAVVQDVIGAARSHSKNGFGGKGGQMASAPESSHA
jgi:hypothetical protein